MQMPIGQPVLNTSSPQASKRLSQRVLCLNDLEALARRHLPRPLFGYVEGATETNATRSDNRAAFDQLAFVPRMLVGVAQRDMGITLFGKKYAAPFGIAPMGISALTAYRGDLIQARAAAEAGIPMIMSSSSLIAVEDVLQAAPGTWFQAYLPRDEEGTIALVERVRRAGVETLVVTVDSAVVPNRENNVRNGFQTPLRPDLTLAMDGITHPRWLFGTFLRTLTRHGMPHFENVGAVRGEPLVSRNVTRDFAGREHLHWDIVRSIRRCWDGPLVLKGILHPADARLAREAGIDGVIVSNHGGRQLDHTVSPLRVLAQVADAAGGMCVMADSGFRRGTDVVKAMALGARCVFVGRPFNYAGAVGGQGGIAHVIRLLKEEIRANMGLLGINRLDELAPEFLYDKSDGQGLLSRSPPTHGKAREAGRGTKWKMEGEATLAAS